MSPRLARLKPLVSLSDSDTLTEQLRLLLRNCTAPTLSGSLLATVMALSLSNPHNSQAMGFWWAATVSWRLLMTWWAKLLLAAPGTFVHLRRTVMQAMALNGVDMLCWGGLAWVALDHADVAESVLVIAVLAGVAGNTMATLAPVLPVFVVTCTIEMVMVVSKVWSMQDHAYDSLGVATVLYVLTLLGHALNSHEAVRSAIQLRFENERLITQLKAESDNARRAQAEAEKANLDKSRFLAAASHDLRQPIHAQGLLLEVLSDEGMSPESRGRALNHAKAAWLASSDMLNTLLDFSRIESGVLNPQVSSFHLQPLLHRIEAEIAPQADAKQLLYRTRDTVLAAQSDPALVELILRNLVSNAVRYSERGGILVCARTQQAGAVVTLEVWDTGVGIAPEHLGEIFREFHQLGNPERDRHKGLGLGLAIAKGLADQLGHHLSVRSVPGRGSCFRLSMPAAQGVVARDHHDHGVPMLPLHLQVLVIDDDVLVQEAMRQLLQRWQCHCMTAESVEQALSLEWPSPPQLILSDYRLRNQATGAQAIAQLRTYWGTDIPAILLTGDTAKERLREAISTGIPLLHKPVSPQQLHQMIKATCLRV
jgi:two-component system, sensor histidine kinase